VPPALPPLLVLLALAFPAPAQNPPVFGVGLDVVKVTVTVRDEAGRLVSNLRAGDFTIKEDGRLQKLAVFAPAADPADREELALNLGMLFDTSTSMREHLASASSRRSASSTPSRGRGT
jgi:hypothetical protein